MAFRKVLVLAMALFALAHLFEPTLADDDDTVPTDFGRPYFPPGFIFGASSSAYQTEGAWNVSGKGPHIWDYFTHTYPDRIEGGTNGDVAIDFYHRYVGDIRMIKDNGLNAFRFSISWARLLPYGKRCKGVNQDGVNFYNNVINELIKQNIEPWVTIYHWDVPLALENEYGGFRSKRIVEDYRDFARLCFELFGDRVKHWMTINEPWTVSLLGYAFGLHAPGRCSCFIGNSYCQVAGNGDAGTEPYIVTHHLLLAHAAAVQEYRMNFKTCQKGEIGFSLCSNWFIPIDNGKVAQEAVDLSLDWSYGWHLSPMTYGKYPDSMRNSLGSRLPEFTKEESYMLIRSFDFVGLNYYGSAYAIPDSNIYNASCLNYFNDYNVTWNGTIYGSNPANLGPWTTIYSAYPKGIRYLLNYTMKKYQNPAIYITENGVSNTYLHDTGRTRFYKDHLWQVHKSIRYDGVNVKGFFAWSLMDNFEWASGYKPRMGIIYIDYDNQLTRIYKDSAKWFMHFLNRTQAPILALNPREAPDQTLDKYDE